MTAKVYYFKQRSIDVVDLAKYDQSWFDRGRNSFIVILWFIVNETLFRWSLHNMYGYRAFLLRIFGCRVGKNTRIRRRVEITYPWKVTIGDNTWVDDDVLLYSLGNINIGSNCSISRRSFLCTGSHDISDEKFNLVIKPINISDGVWIQSCCFISQGVDIGKNCVIGVQSTVLKSMPDNMVCYGIPCRPIKRRVIVKQNED